MGGLVLALCQLVAIVLFVGGLLTIGELVGEDVAGIWQQTYRGQQIMFCVLLMVAAVLLSVVSGAAYELQRVRRALERHLSPIPDTRKS